MAIPLTGVGRMYLEIINNDLRISVHPTVQLTESNQCDKNRDSLPQKQVQTKKLDKN